MTCSDCDMALTCLVMPCDSANACRFVCVMTMPRDFRDSVSPVKMELSFCAATSVEMFLNDAMSAASWVMFIAMSVAAAPVRPMPVAMSP